MAVDERGPIGQPRFLGTGADDQAADLTLLGEEIYERGTRLVLTATEMDDLVSDGLAYEGLEVYCLDDGVTYVRVSSAWKRATGNRCRIKRNATAVTVTTAFTKIGVGFDADVTTPGIVWASNRFEVASSGRYRLTGNVYTSGAGGFMLLADALDATSFPSSPYAWQTGPHIASETGMAVSLEFDLTGPTNVYLNAIHLAGTSGVLRVAAGNLKPWLALERIS